MALILNIDTALNTASICMAKNGIPVSILKNEQKTEHASWIHTAIKEMLRLKNVPIASLDAIAVTIGPGSYTGLRVGLATAKGFCFAISKPLITCGTLYNMAMAVKESVTDLLVPMIDARRMEIFTAVYRTIDLKEIEKPKPLILGEDSFSELLKRNSITFVGNGSKKFQPLCKNNNAVFLEIEADASTMAMNSELLFNNKEFADLAYSEPLYLKDFHTTGH